MFRRSRHPAEGDELGPKSPEWLFDISHEAGKVAAPREMIDAEKAYILRYRGNTLRDAADPMLGLALSGGGIRSASIALGVLQALAAKGKLQKFDYLSTVSGGGYIGSALTWFTSQEWKIDEKLERFGTGDGQGTIPPFPFGTRGPVTPPSHPLRTPDLLLRYLSQHANYLEPTKGVSIIHPLKGINILAALAVVLRGIAVNVFIWLTVMTFLFFLLILPSPEYGTLAGAHIPGVFVAALMASAAIALLFCGAALVYSLMTGIPAGLFPGIVAAVGDYRARRFIDGFVPLSLVIAAALVLFGLLPAVDYLLQGFVKYVGPSAILGGVATGLWTFWQSRHQATRAPSFASSLVAPVGAFLILYGTALFAYKMALAVATDDPNARWLESVVGWTHAEVVMALCIVAGVAALTGWFANLNYTSIHRYYRDRLMESFLPDPDRAAGNLGGPASQGDSTRLADVCKPTEARGPYHLINCNVMLNNSERRVWNLRGGDSFVLAPRYCGSSATGWVATDGWLKDPLSLATAMAVSGAAANPGTGTGGVGPMRDQLVSILMSMLNLRLGVWLPNPWWGGRIVTPDHFHPGLTEMLGMGRREDSGMLQLTDGGHFDNLGVYELIRRKVRLIVVSDGTADPKFAFADLLTLLPRLREDFGATIRFDRPPLTKEPAPTVLPAALDFTLPHLDPVALPRYPAGVPLARCGFAMADISYADGSKGTLIYLKAAVVETMDLELLGYKGKTPDFPNESTLDQFYSEEKFEVHRSVGFTLASQMLEAVKDHEASHQHLTALHDPELPRSETG